MKNFLKALSRFPYYASTSTPAPIQEELTTTLTPEESRVLFRKALTDSPLVYLQVQSTAHD
jgi:hypothetical protein